MLEVDYPKKAFAGILGFCDIEADENKVNFTFIDGRFVEEKNRLLCCNFVFPNPLIKTG